MRMSAKRASLLPSAAGNVPAVTMKKKHTQLQNSENRKGGTTAMHTCETVGLQQKVLETRERPRGPGRYTRLKAIA